MRINHCGSHVGMPQHCLNRPYVVIRLQKMRSETVPKSMRFNAFAKNKSVPFPNPFPFIDLFRRHYGASQEKQDGPGTLNPVLYKHHPMPSYTPFYGSKLVHDCCMPQHTLGLSQWPYCNLRHLENINWTFNATASVLSCSSILRENYLFRQ